MKKIILILILLASVLFIFMMHCYYNYQFWTHFKTDNFMSLVEYNGSSLKGFRGRQILIHKDFQKYLEQIDRYAENNHIELIINHSYRNDKQTLHNNIVKPGTLSNHLAGFAIDFNIICNGRKYLSHDLKKNKLKNLPENIRNFIHEIRENKDLRWGGDFYPAEDPVHIDKPINLESRDLWMKNKNNCELDYTKRIPKWKFWM